MVYWSPKLAVDNTFAIGVYEWSDDCIDDVLIWQHLKEISKEMRSKVCFNGISLKSIACFFSVYFCVGVRL